MTEDVVEKYFSKSPAAAPVTRNHYYEGPGQLFTEDEIAAANAKEYARNESAMAAIKAAGFIRYPLRMETVAGEEVEREAWLHPAFTPSSSKGFFKKHGMNFNIYVPSYERAGEAGTLAMLDRFGVENYYICIDPSQFETYSQVYPLERLVIRDISLREPDLLDPVSSIKHPITMAGHAPLCNFTLALSRSLGEDYFWFMDDDFSGLAMKAKKGDQPLQPNEVYDKDNFYRCSNIFEEYGFNFQKFMEAMEELTFKVKNPGFVGLEKFGTVFSLPVCWRTGTRVYSYYLTKNETQVSHISRQNNDVVTSIELTKHGLVNMLFEGISYNSGATQGAGGQSEMYARFGTLDKGKILARAQPNFSKISYEYSRIHHNVDFTHVTKQRLVGDVVQARE
jgi:hypothetical protein